MESTNWLGMIHWDFSTILLIFMSLISVAAIFERFIRYRSADIDSGEFMNRIRDHVRNGRINEALQLAEQTPGPVAAVVKAGILTRGRTKDEIRDTIDRVRMRQAAYLEKNLPILGTVGATAPFVGLFGTVLGIMRAFHDISLAGAAGTAVVASGIAQALIATAGGLIVAIIAVIFYNIYLNWSNHFGVEMDTAANEVLHLVTNSTPAVGTVQR